ncbi:cell division protein FtsX [Parerythrobacter jejuensis]|uniref:Cell division protein n=1 Tax=Parerythrobacter jejuensis TaxID=795812 RepID=A0A845ANU6_9SPHN|nr:cell division protein [Parerythrobacter jejuensis]MXP31284.1 cell division protein [Parerythrobacter jejuensis]MXP34044.1 cell division protein [Parerythrobacter jejuensis]
MSRPPVIKNAVKRGLAPFRGDQAAQLVPQGSLAGPMPWVIAIMVALTVIATAAGLALSNLAEGARAELSGGATVQVVEADPVERARQAAAVEEVLANFPEVASIRLIPEDELSQLLEPWLGTGMDSEAVPVPALIDVRLREGVNPDKLRRMRAALIEAAPDARIDAQSTWLQPVFSAIASLQYLSMALVVLLAVTSAAAVFLAARSALGVSRETIEIVHLLGGTDTQIARVFQRSVGFDATMGGAVGLALGLGAVLFLGQRFAALDSGMVTGGGLGWLDWLAVAAVPLITVALAMVTARVTVVAALRKML